MRKMVPLSAVTFVILALLAISLPALAADNSPTQKTATKRKSAKSKPAPPPVADEKAQQLEETMQKQAKTIEDLKRAMEQMRAQMQQQMDEIQKLQTGVDQSKAAAEEANRRVGDLTGVPGQVQALQANTDSLGKNLVDIKKSADEAKKTSETVARGLDGFKFSGDFRLRFDGIFRPSNPALGETHQQNARARYRIRFNVDNSMNKNMDFHLQLATGPMNNALTNDQDFNGIVGRAPFLINEAWADVHNTSKTLSIRGGRVAEVFADNAKFIFDDDVRFNGFNEIAVYKVSDSGFLRTVEFRGGQYIFASPNVAIVTAGSPLAVAGATVGSTGRASQMFHEGVVFKGEINPRWKQELIIDDQYFRNPNEIQLASTTTGQPVLVNGPFGITLSGPFTNGLGNGTTTAGGSIYTAPNFNVVRASYKLNWNGSEKFPVEWNVQVARNVSAHFLRDGLLTYISIGRSKNAGDWRFLYIYTIKDANAFVSQFTDDDIGTNTGVNIAAHAFRLDYTINKHLAFQNILYVQSERRPSDPSKFFFVPLPQGTPTQYRYQSQLQFSF